ncbi:WxL domain-containing protein [Enterococcus sp. AZ109]|uniref:WxL domain-containing protein n=1 Tax=Enterococcus sp. AZ109 TaxID=2774634 RepID=UPI003F26A276
MKRTKIGFALVSLFVLASSSTGALAAEYKSTGEIDFMPGSEVTPPVDPNDPDPNNPVDPVDPTDPDGPNPGTPGPLSIDYASSLDFGLQEITNQDRTYYARAQRYKDPSALTRNYVQVTDTRGEYVGWTLSVKQDGAFASSVAKKYKTLDGARLTLTDPKVDSPMTDGNEEAAIAPIAGTSVVLDGVNSQIVMMAEANKGAGTWVNGWGNVETITEKDHKGDDVNVAVTRAVSLSIPGKTPKEAVKYQTELVWTLANTPVSN